MPCETAPSVRWGRSATRLRKAQGHHDHDWRPWINMLGTVVTLERSDIAVLSSRGDSHLKN
jgi:hypothetical protein